MLLELVNMLITQDTILMAQHIQKQSHQGMS